MTLPGDPGSAIGEDVNGVRSESEISSSWRVERRVWRSTVWKAEEREAVFSSKYR